MYRSSINRVKIKNLFNKYDYDIDLDNSQDVAIIIAPNGRGKTTIFHLINFIMNPSYGTFSHIRNIPFDSCTLSFENGRSIKLTKFKCDIIDYINEENISIKDAQREIAGRILQFLNAGSNVAYNFRLFVDRNDGQSSIEDIDFYDCLINRYAELRSRGLDIDSYDGDDAELYIREGRQMSSITPRFAFLFRSIKSKLENARLNIPTAFIEAGRTQNSVGAEQYDRRSDRSNPLEPILQAKEKIDKLVIERLDQYEEIKGKSSEGLAMNYYKGYRTYNDTRMDYKTFANAWSAYNADIDKYAELGLLTVSEDDRIEFGTEEGTEKFETGKEVYNSIGSFLNALLHANDGNTEPLKDIYGKLLLFKRIFDKRNAITNKKILFTKNGLNIVDTTDGNNGATIPIQCLSSGEKNDFIMFYELIFNVSPRSLVLIDEPEISLHIAWQEDFLDYLLDICAENNIQAIVATHSPNIINGHFDLIVEK